MPRRAANCPSAERLVRQAVIKLCLSAPGRSVRLLSTREYALKFGFTVRTITTELSKLVKEGWIRGQKGRGYFSRPEHFPSARSPEPIIGMIFGDTQDISYDANRWDLQAYTGSALARHNFPVRPLQFSRLAPDMVIQEMDRLGLDGAVLILCPSIWKKAFHSYAASGKKVVCMLEEIGGLSFAGIDWKRCGKDLARQLSEYPVRGPVLWCDFHDESNAEIRKGFQTVWKRPPVEIFPMPQEMLFALESMLKEKKLPAAVFCHNGWAPDIAAVFTRYGFDPYRDTVLISNDAQLCKMPDLCGIFFGYPFAELGNAAAELLSEPKRGRRVLLPMKIFRRLPDVQ